jgi:hypothetical protein
MMNKKNGNAAKTGQDVGQGQSVPKETEKKNDVPRETEQIHAQSAPQAEGSQNVPHSGPETTTPAQSIPNEPQSNPKS